MSIVNDNNNQNLECIKDKFKAINYIRIIVFGFIQFVVFIFLLEHESLLYYAGLPWFFEQMPYDISVVIRNYFWSTPWEFFVIGTRFFAIGTFTWFTRKIFFRNKNVYSDTLYLCLAGAFPLIMSILSFPIFISSLLNTSWIDFFSYEDIFYIAIQFLLIGLAQRFVFILLKKRFGTKSVNIIAILIILIVILIFNFQDLSLMGFNL